MLRLRVLWSRWTLDAKLVAGADPESDPALRMRAAQLCSAGHRRRIAACLESLVRSSDPSRAPSLTSAVPVVRRQVVEARDSLLLLAQRLRQAEPLRPRGVAMVERLLTDGASVLYTDTARGAVELRVRMALDLL